MLCVDSLLFQFARRMAVLVFVDLACWLPLAVFGMAATFAGSPLVDIPAAKVGNSGSTYCKVRMNVS